MALKPTKTVEFTDWELNIVHNALATYHNSFLDKRRKMRPSERAIGMAEAKKIIEKVQKARGDEE